MNHNICVLSLIIFLLNAVIKYIQKYKQYHEQRPIRLLSALEKPKSNPEEQVSFHSDKVNKNETISERDER